MALVGYQGVDGGHVLGPGQVTDVCLLALAVAHEGRVVTFDTRMSREAVRGISAESHLVLRRAPHRPAWFASSFRREGRAEMIPAICLAVHADDRVGSRAEVA
ncbi:MAG: hypothetical protein LBS27_10505 [Bifidobacteriaceae bacterium]|nr:hypothetical protein [Bifidobacteriaceae bacterium]